MRRTLTHECNVASLAIGLATGVGATFLDSFRYMEPLVENITGFATAATLSMFYSFLQEEEPDYMALNMGVSVVTSSLTHVAAEYVRYFI
jgi:hypothetical protein